MKVDLGSPADLRRINPDLMCIAQRLRVDDLENVLDRPGKGEVDRERFHRRAEIGDAKRPAGDLNGFNRAAGGHEIQRLVCKRGGPADPSYRSEPAEVVD